MVRRVLRCENPTCNFVLKVESASEEAAKVMLNYGTINPVVGRPYEMNCPQCTTHALKSDPKLVVKLRDGKDK